MPEDNEKQNSEEAYTNKYQKHVASIYGCNVVCDRDKFSKFLKYYLGEDADYNFINSMIEESNYCIDIAKKKKIKKRTCNDLKRW